MFAKIRGRRTTALATTLAVVVGLAITPALTATAAEGDESVIVEALVAEQAPVAEVVEAPAEPAPVPEPAPVAEPVEAPSVATPAAESPAQAGEAAPPAPQALTRSIAEAESPTVGVLATAAISPASISNQVIGQPIDIQFSGVDADGWRVAGGAASVTMSASGRLTGSFSRAGSQTLTVTATKSVWNPPIWFIPGYWTTETAGSARYTFDVLPAVTTTSLPEATVGVGYSQLLAATRSAGLVSDVFTVVSGTLPPGLNLNRSSGKITGTVATIPTSPVTYNFSVRLTHDLLFGGSYDSAPQPLSITVGYPAPAVNNASLPPARVGTAYTAPALTATGLGTITWSASGLPTGLSINPSTGVISGTPEYNPSYLGGTLVGFTVIADNGSASAPRSFQISVSTPIPTLSDGALPAATVGVAYDVALSVTNGYGTLTFRLAGGSLPAGLELTTDGRITGTPAHDFAAGAIQETDVRIEVSGTAGSHSKVFTFTLLTPAPAIDTTSLATGWWKQPYSQVIEASGPGVTLSVRGLPAGLTFDGSSISGQTRWTGNRVITITAWNSAAIVERELTLTINDGPNLHRTPVVTMQTGDSYTSAPVSYDGEEVVLTLGSDAPAGMKLNRNNRIKWTPTASGVYLFTITATNPAGTDTQRYAIRVLDAPVITHGSLEQGVIDMALRQKLQHDGTNVKFSVVRGDLPNGLKLTRNGVLKGTATEAGTFTFKVRAHNAVGVDSKWFTLTVLQPATTLSSSSVIRGNSVTVSGSGYLPGDDLELWLHSTPVLLGKVTATNGAFTTTVVIPANTPAGAHHLVVTGARSGTQSMPLTIAMPAAPQQPQSTTPTQRPVLTVIPAEATAEVTEVTADDEAGAGAAEEADEELPTLNKPVAEAETTATVPANWSGLIVAAFVLLLAALLVWFLVWRRRRAAES